MRRIQKGILLSQRRDSLFALLLLCGFESLALNLESYQCAFKQFLKERKQRNSARVCFTLPTGVVLRGGVWGVTSPTD